jgi:hypothetical protein
MTWVEFTAKPYAMRILPDRTGFYYFAGEVLDLPPEWAAEHFARGEAIEAPPPAAFLPDNPWLPPSLGDDPLTVACVWRSGGVYDHHDYLGPLSRAVARNLSAPHRFVCLTDHDGPMPAGVERIALHHRWPRYWSKVELFRPGLFTGPVLYLDLDTVVCGPIDDVAASPEPVLAAWDLKRGWLNSSAVRWSVDLSFVHARMVADPPRTMAAFQDAAFYGDQGLLQDEMMRRNVPWRWMQDAFGPAVQWHPTTTRGGAAPAGCAIAMWYGHPKPHEVRSDWLAQHWR